MRKLISSPIKMPLSDSENQIYQKALNLLPDIMLNLMAVKVKKHPEDFSSWCFELCRICRDEINFDLLESIQLPRLDKLQDLLESGVSLAQMKMLRIAPWPIFSGFIFKNAEIQALDERLALLDYLQSIKEQPLAQMCQEDRLAFTGQHTRAHSLAAYKFDVEWFSSTKSAKVFHRLLVNHPQAFDRAIDCIPAAGDVNFQDYQQFVAAYLDIFNKHGEGQKASLIPATRLLAMRRPDQFIALTNAKIDVICQGFDIVKLNNHDFDNYWHDLIGTLRTMPWWHQSKPDGIVDGEKELTLWQYRAILVDLFLFADESLAQKSTYWRLTQKAADKANNSVVSTNKLTAIKRTKASAENLVDQALLNEELPAYLKNKRDSIVKAVKEGKSVEHVINMMRAIFG